MSERDLPATKRDLEDFKVEVNSRFSESENRIDQHLSEMEGRIVTTVYRLGESMPAEVGKRLNLPPAP